WVVNCEAAATVAPITSAVEATIDQAAPRRGVRTRPTRFGAGGWRIFRQDLSDRGERYKSVIEEYRPFYQRARRGTGWHFGQYYDDRFINLLRVISVSMPASWHS